MKVDYKEVFKLIVITIESEPELKIIKEVVGRALYSEVSTDTDIKEDIVRSVMDSLHNKLKKF